MIDLLLKHIYIELSQIAWRFQPDTLRRRLLIVVLIQLQRWKTARLLQSVERNDPTQPQAVTAAEAIANVENILGVQNHEECEHGEMRWKEGEKNGRNWGGFFCTGPSQAPHAACPTRWYNLASSGKWEKQKARV